MSLSMYQASVPVLARMLTNLHAILGKVMDHASKSGIAESELLDARLAPDMFPFSRQVQIATDMAKSCVSRLAGEEPPGYEDKEATLAELVARVERTLAHVKSFKPGQIDGTEDKDIELKMRNGPMRFKGQAYLLFFVMPNFYFHLTTAYGLMRHKGIELGKMDFLGRG